MCFQNSFYRNFRFRSIQIIKEILKIKVANQQKQISKEIASTTSKAISEAVTDIVFIVIGDEFSK